MLLLQVSEKKRPHRSSDFADRCRAPTSFSLRAWPPPAGPAASRRLAGGRSFSRGCVSSPVARRRRAANIPLLRRPRACGQTEWRRVLFCRASGSPGGGMDMGRIPPSETYRRASFQADSLGETPIRRGYASGAYPPRIHIGYVSDTDTGSPYYQDAAPD